MIEKVTLENALGGLGEASYVDSFLGTYNSQGSLIQAKKAIKWTGNVGLEMTKGEWYRIAVSELSNNIMSTAILSITTSFNNSTPRGAVAVIFANGFGANNCNMLSKANSFSGRIRVLHKKETNSYPILEYKCEISGSNKHIFTYGNAYGFVFQNPVHVSDTPEEGYEVDEFVIN